MNTSTRHTHIITSGVIALIFCSSAVAHTRQYHSNVSQVNSVASRTHNHINQKLNQVIYTRHIKHPLLWSGGNFNARLKRNGITLAYDF